MNELMQFRRREFRTAASQCVLTDAITDEVGFWISECFLFYLIEKSLEIAMEVNCDVFSLVDQGMRYL